MDDLVAILRLAYSGELAAALAYRGHWKSVSDAEDRRRIRQIEEEEWHHRGLVGNMLRDLGESPGKLREVPRMAHWPNSGSFAISPVGSLRCRAGKLESRNVREYEAAARLPWRAGGMNGLTAS